MAVEEGGRSAASVGRTSSEVALVAGHASIQAGGRMWARASRT